jgi:MAF protein
VSSLVLASGSPRRAELLTAAGFEFEIISPNVLERSELHLSPREVTGWNAVRKGMAVAKLYPDKVVLAADTEVEFENEIIGKPNDLAHAHRILKRLSGRSHHVYSSVYVSSFSKSRTTLFCAISRVTFRKLNEDRIREYLQQIDPLDKAGAYAAQGNGADIIARIDGSYSNVVGLPMERTIAVLRDFGVQPLRPVSQPSPFRAAQLPDKPSGHGAARGRGTRR